jgi:hypothetical protein
MRQELDHNRVFQKPETVADDFALIGEAIADAVRGLSSSSRLESYWSRLRFCGWNCR